MPTSGPNPDRPALRRRLHEQGLRGVRPARVRRRSRPRGGARPALRQRGSRGRQQRADLQRDGHALPRQTPAFAFFSNPYINPGVHGEPRVRDRRHPRPLRRPSSQLQPKLSVNWKPTDDLRVFRARMAMASAAADSTHRAARRRSRRSTAGCVSARRRGPAAAAGTPVCRTPSQLTDVTTTTRRKSRRPPSSASSRSCSTAADAERRDLPHEGRRHAVLQFLRGPVWPAAGRDQHRRGHDPGRGARLPLAGQRPFSVFGGYRLHRWRDRQVRRAGRTRKATSCPYSPEYTGNLGAELTFPLGRGPASCSTRLDATFVGETWFHPVQNETVPNLFTAFGFGQGEFSKMKRDPYAVLNARIGLQGEQLEHRRSGVATSPTRNTWRKSSPRRSSAARSSTIRRGAAMEWT